MVNYGAIGAVSGHEMGHGFDDQGNQFSASGKFESWWMPEARTAFTRRTAALSKQYDAYEPIPGVHMKGALTLGENIGDLGGVETAYAACQKYQAEHGKEPVIGALAAVLPHQRDRPERRRMIRDVQREARRRVSRSCQSGAYLVKLKAAQQPCAPFSA